MSLPRLPVVRTKMVAFCAALVASVSCSGGASAIAGATEASSVFRLDGHAHLMANVGPGRFDYAGAVAQARDTMDGLGIDFTIVMPPPFADAGRPAYDAPLLADAGRPAYDAPLLADALSGDPEHFGFLAGGGTLNPMIQDAVRGVAVDPGEFRRVAEGILAAGALGFGEITAEHLVIGGSEPYLSAPADHALFLLLSDIAAENDVPIEIHMEAVSEDMPPPAWLRSPANPDVLRANIVGFERLLEHRRDAKIIWAHAGWDTTGQRPAELCGALLDRLPNL